MLNAWHEIKKSAEKVDETIAKALSSGLTREEWIKIIYEQMIRYSYEPLNDADELELMQKSTRLLPNEPHFEENLKVLRLFSELHHSDASISLKTQIKGVSDERYRAVTRQLLSIEIAYLEDFHFPIANTVILRQRIDLIKRLHQLAKPMKTPSETTAYQTDLRDWIFRLTSLFLQHLQLLTVREDFSDLFTHHGSEYLSFADEVYHLTGCFPEAEQVSLYKRLQQWYDAGASHYDKLTLKPVQLSVEERFFCQQDYDHIRQWARFASRSAFISFLNDKDQGLLAYQRLYETLLGKHRVLKKTLLELRRKIEETPSDLLQETDNDFTIPLDLLNKQIMALFNVEILLDACFELNKVSENALIMNQENFRKIFNMPLEKERISTYAPEFFTEPVVSSTVSPRSNQELMPQKSGYIPK